MTYANVVSSHVSFSLNFIGSIDLQHFDSSTSTFQPINTQQNIIGGCKHENNRLSFLSDIIVCNDDTVTRS